MTKPRIVLPDRFPFVTRLTVRITDLNYGAHVGNDRMLGLLHEARHRFLVQHGATELAVGGVRLVVSDAVVTYHAEVHAGDVLDIGIAGGERGPTRAELLYRVKRVMDEKVVARGMTGLVFLDPTVGAVTSPPGPLFAWLELEDAGG